MSAEEFLALAEGQKGQSLSRDGAVVATATERILHSRCKGLASRSLSADSAGPETPLVDMLTVQAASQSRTTP